MKESFWDFPSCSKIDVLEEPQHALIIYNALQDDLTVVEPSTGTDWCLYGKEEALLVQPSSYYLKIILFLYYKLVITNTV
jgi:hypothetical protein